MGLICGGDTMKKIISIFISLVLVIYGFTGCIDDKSSVSPPPDEMARLQSIDIIKYFENKDIDGLKSMFCNKVQSEHNLDKEIEGAFEFIKGKIISYDEPDGTSGGGLIKDGIRVELILRGKITNIKTDKGYVYRVTFSSYGIHESDPDRIGISQLSVFSQNDSRYIIGDYDTANP